MSRRDRSTPRRARATLNLVLVLDGLRPDAITPEETPNLWRLRQEGVDFPNSHAVFPTVTRVNATAIATGTYPARNGILGNRIYVRAVDPNFAFNNDDHRNLMRLDEVTGGRMVLVKSLGEELAERGKRLAAVSSGSTGSALLLNPRAPKGVGVLINGYWEPGVRVAFPADGRTTRCCSASAAAPRQGRRHRRPTTPSVAWTQGVLRDYVLPELKPDVVVNWLTEPDHIQHGIGAGSPQARAAIRAVDRRDRAPAQASSTRSASRTRPTSSIVSDHGFGHGVFGVNLNAELIKAGLKAQRRFRRRRDRQQRPDHAAARQGPRPRAASVGSSEFLQAQDWIGVLFTAGQRAVRREQIEGVEPGTFALELIHLAHAERGPDIVVTFPSSIGVQPVRRARHGLHRDRAPDRPAYRHPGQPGSMSPWTVRNTFIAWGVRLQARGGGDPHAGEQCRSDPDAARPARAQPQLDGSRRFDGRAIIEAFADGPDQEQVPMRHDHPCHRDARRRPTVWRSRSVRSAHSATSTRAGGCDEPVSMHPPLMRTPSEGTICHNSAGAMCASIAAVYSKGKAHERQQSPLFYYCGPGRPVRTHHRVRKLVHDRPDPARRPAPQRRLRRGLCSPACISNGRGSMRWSRSTCRRIPIPGPRWSCIWPISSRPISRSRSRSMSPPTRCRTCMPGSGATRRWRQRMIIAPHIAEKTKVVFGQYTAARAISARGQLNADLAKALTEFIAYDPVFVIESVQIEDISFSGDYIKSVEQRMQAEVEVQRLRQYLSARRCRPRSPSPRPKGRADAVRAEAQANADAIRFRGEAEGAAIKARGTGEASAIEARGAADATAIRAKGDALEANPQLVPLIQAERWDGKLPVTAGLGGAVPMVGLGQR